MKYTYKKCFPKKIVIPLLLFCGVILSPGCSNINGKVLDNISNEPIKGVKVIATWKQNYLHGSGCFSVSSAITDENGEYVITKPRPRIIGRMWQDKLVVYKQGYTLNRSKYDSHVGVTQYLNKSKSDSDERLEYLSRLVSSTFCYGAGSENFDKYSFYEEVINEAIPLAKTSDQFELIWSICEDIASLVNRDSTKDERKVFLEKNNPECLKLKIDPEENKRVLDTFLSGDKRQMNKLIDKGFKIDRIFYPNTTALMVAVKNVRLKSIQALIELGANPNDEIIYQPHILHQILNEKKLREYSKISVINLLVKLGADMHVIDERKDITLTLAAGIGHIDIINSLIDKGAVVNPVSKTTQYQILYLQGQPPLAFAKNIKVAKILINAGADPTIEFSNGFSLLMHAARNNKSEIVKLLIQKGAEVNKLDNAGNNALMHTMYKYRVHNNGFNRMVSRRDRQIFDKLFNENKEKILDTIRALIQLGGNVNQKNKSGEKLINFSEDPDFRALIRNGHKIH